METMRWKNGQLELLDQTLLPLEVSYYVCRRYQDVAHGIKTMIVRGAPAIGAAAAYGIALAAREVQHNSISEQLDYLARAKEELALTRPTAVNLFWALDRMNGVVKNWDGKQKLADLLLQEAHRILAEDIADNKRMGQYGAEVVPHGATILTHCNAGALATGGYGTALGVIRAAHEAGKNISVFADETRPLLQGARLTAFELMQDGIPVTLITDNMAGYVMKKGLIDLVIVGADRITARGDVANKIGTYSVAVLAKEHNIPFYVAAPLSTFDLNLQSGDDIPIEEREAKEVREVFGQPTAPREVQVFNPAFDVTPARLITGIITEAGYIEHPDESKVRALCQVKTGCKNAT